MAAEDRSTELLPLLDSDEPFFDVGIRGYDKRQVDGYVARIEAEIADLKAARDSALATSADRAAQLASREAHIESLKQQAAKTVKPPDSVTVSDRIRDMLQLATDEAAQTRRNAEEEADRVLAAARSDAERVRAEAAAAQQRLTAGATQRSAEADQKLAQARTQVAAELERARAQGAAEVEQAQVEGTRIIEAATAELDKARAEGIRILDEAVAELDKARDAAARDSEAAAAERARLDAESAAARAAAEHASIERLQTAEQDFEITLRSRRSSAERQAQLDHDEAKAAAEKLVADARQQAAALDAERQQTHQRLRELHAQLSAIIEDATAT
jgi:cell division septum initiation protein DivIVA